MTCGGDIGNAGKYLKKLCETKQIRYRGCAAIPMPENYIALFSTPTAEHARQKIEQSERVIDKAALSIERGEAFPQRAVTMRDQLCSGIVNILFYPLFVHAKKFHATDACVSCGYCAAVCPRGNIRLAHGAPVWGKECTHCMACICRCPREAIEYGRHSKGKPRYTCPKNTLG